jgi:hypothetical protein
MVRDLAARAKIRNGVMRQLFPAHRLPAREELGFEPNRKDRAAALRGMPVGFTRSDVSMVYQTGPSRWSVLMGQTTLRDKWGVERSFATKAGALRAARNAEARRAVQ